MILSAALAIPLAANAQTVFPPARNYEVHELTLNGSGCLVTDIDRGMAVGLCNDGKLQGALSRGPKRWESSILAIWAARMQLPWVRATVGPLDHPTLSGDLTAHAMRVVAVGGNDRSRVARWSS